jgi:hypothetical protein
MISDVILMTKTLFAKSTLKRTVAGMNPPAKEDKIKLISSLQLMK